jgi:hypothetical protein
MALQLPVSNHQRQPHDEISFDRKIGDLAGRWRKQS